MSFLSFVLLEEFFFYVVKAQYDTGEPSDGGYGIVESKASNTACAVPFAVGDANFDSETTIEDVLTLVDFILEETTPSSAAFNNSDDIHLADIKDALNKLKNFYSDRSIELVKVANGYRLKVKQDYSTWISKLWETKPQKFSRAMMETLALIAYKQPITRAEIEEVRGVSVSSQIIRNLMDRGWIKVVGHRDVPGRPSLLSTTKDFLDDLNLRKLSDLPELPDIGNMPDEIQMPLLIEEQKEEKASIQE